MLGWAASGERHTGVICTVTPTLPPRGPSYPENLIAALTTLLESPPKEQREWVHRLQ